MFAAIDDMWFFDPEQRQRGPREPMECPNCGALVYPPQVLFVEYDEWRMKQLGNAAAAALSVARQKRMEVPF